MGHDVCKTLQQSYRNVVQRRNARVYATGSSRETSGDQSPPHATYAAPWPPSSTSRPSRRRQQQELIWGAPPTGSLPPPPPRRQQQDLEPDNGTGTPAEAAPAEVLLDQAGVAVAPADLLAQRDEALLMRGGRHRNRKPVASLPLPPPNQPDQGTLRSPSRAASGADRMRPAGDDSTASSAAVAARPAFSDLEGKDGSAVSDSAGVSRGIMLRLRRRSAAAQAPRRIRLPLSQRPQPWPVKVLLEAKQQQRQPGQFPLEPVGPLQGGEAGEEGAAGRPCVEQQRVVQARQAQQQVGEQQQHHHQQEQQQEEQKHQQVLWCQQQQQPQAQQGTHESPEGRKPGGRMEVRVEQHSGPGSPPQPPLPPQPPADPDIARSRLVSAHPDGTLWSYFNRDVGPLATRMLQQLLLPTGSKKAVAGDGRHRGAETAACANYLGDVGGGDGSCESHSSGGAVTAAGGGTCHVLVAGSHQAYNVLRALSYAQGALRVASYNRVGYGGGGRSPLQPPPSGPTVCFTASDVSVPDLRSFYEQTVRHGTGRTPQVGPPPIFVSGACRGNENLEKRRRGLPLGSRAAEAEPRAGGPPPPFGAAAAAVAAAAALEENGAVGPSAGRKKGRGYDRDAAPPTLLGWPDDVALLEPRALVSAFLVQPPLELWQIGAAATAAAGLPPVAVGAASDVASLTQLLAVRLKKQGHCTVEALGRAAASRALAALSGACGALYASGLGVVAFPYMKALGPQPRAELPSPPPQQLTPGQRTTTPGRQARGRGGQRARLLSSAAVPATASAGAAASEAVAALEPVLLDKAPQLVLQLVRCEWDEQGRPVVPERLAPVSATVVRAGFPRAASSAGPVDRSTKPESESDQDSAFGPDPPAGATQPQSAQRSQLDGRDGDSSGSDGSSNGGSVSGGSGSSTRPVRLAVPPLAGGGPRMVLLFGGPDGGPDTRTAAAEVARALAAGRRVRLAAARLGALLRLPVVVFRAQGALARLESPARRVLAFTLHPAAAEPPARRSSGGGGPDGGGGAAGHEQRQAPQAPEKEGVEAPPGDALVAEVFRLPMSALQHHLDSLPGPPQAHITAKSVGRRLQPGTLGDDEYDGDGGGHVRPQGRRRQQQYEPSGRSNRQQHVQAAAAVAVEQLFRYGTATLVGHTPGRRLTALLAAACVSEGLMHSAGLTVLVRVDPRVARVAPAVVAQPQVRRRRLAPVPERADPPTAPAVLRPVPPKRYQLLLARMDPWGGRLQLLRPCDLTALKREVAAAAAAGSGSHAKSPTAIQD